MDRRKHAPQRALSEFWDKFQAKRTGKVTAIFPPTLYKHAQRPIAPDGAGSSRNAAESYEAAATECRERIERIHKECKRTNEKFTDPDFDIEYDPDHNCIYGLIRSARLPPRPPVKRLKWIFKEPQFTINGYSSSDVYQGGSGDCWWVAAVAAIAHRKDLMDKVCVAQDEKSGAYAFVFYRDGDWIPVVIDDNLYLDSKDYYNADCSSEKYDPTRAEARKHREKYQTGSEALLYAKCKNPNETWLPLLEKAYAKAHGDYDTINGGFPGQGIEDLTGGVSTTLLTNRVFEEDRLWGELLESNDGNEASGFVFTLSALPPEHDPDLDSKAGVTLQHAYSILQAVDYDEEGVTTRLVKVRNPWGEKYDAGLGDWNGPWSDGSKEWTAKSIARLGHTFGNDGVSWMTFEDMLEIFTLIHRTRLFGKEWTVVQQWMTADVAWITGYLPAKFYVTVTKPGTVVFVLSQLDDRYFKGLEGEYYFSLHFILQNAGADANQPPICSVRPAFERDWRSVSCEVELEPGRYEVLPKVTATRWYRNGEPLVKPIEDIVEEYIYQNPQKLRQLGMSYDTAHAKGAVADVGKRRAKGGEEKTAQMLSAAEKAFQHTVDVMRKISLGEEVRQPHYPASGSGHHDSESWTRAGGDDEASSVSDAESYDSRDRFHLPQWNAVAVIGLRVYARDPDVSIKLVHPGDKEEIDRPAGATT